MRRILAGIVAIAVLAVVVAAALWMSRPRHEELTATASAAATRATSRPSSTRAPVSSVYQMSLIVAAIATRLVTATATRAQVAHVGQAMVGSRLSMPVSTRAMSGQFSLILRGMVEPRGKVVSPSKLLIPRIICLLLQLLQYQLSVAVRNRGRAGVRGRRPSVRVDPLRTLHSPSGGLTVKDGSRYAPPCSPWTL